MASRKDIRDISELIRKKLEHYMNVERREARFDPRGRYTTTSKMHKYDFLYKVLDSAVLDATRRESMRQAGSPERPRTSVRSPQLSATTRKPNERAKSGLVRPSYSPKRDRRANKRVGSPDLAKRRNKDDRPRPLAEPRPSAENTSGSRESLQTSSHRSEDIQKPVGKVRPAKANDTDEAETSTPRHPIRPHLDTSSRRVVLHREHERLASYADKIFASIPVDELQIIHRYRPSYHDDHDRKYQGYSRHVGSILRSKEFVDYYDDVYTAERTPRTPRRDAQSSSKPRSRSSRQACPRQTHELTQTPRSRNTMFSSLVDNAQGAAPKTVSRDNDVSLSPNETLTPTYTTPYRRKEPTLFPESHDPFRPAELDRPPSPTLMSKGPRPLPVSSIRSSLKINFDDEKIDWREKRREMPALKHGTGAVEKHDIYNEPGEKAELRLNREDGNIEIRKEETIERDQQLYKIKQIVVVSRDEQEEQVKKKEMITEDQSIHTENSPLTKPLERQEWDQDASHLSEKSVENESTQQPLASSLNEENLNKSKHEPIHELSDLKHERYSENTSHRLPEPQTLEKVAVVKVKRQDRLEKEKPPHKERKHRKKEKPTGTDKDIKEKYNRDSQKDKERDQAHRSEDKSETISPKKEDSDNRDIRAGQSDKTTKEIVSERLDETHDQKQKEAHMNTNVSNNINIPERTLEKKSSKIVTTGEEAKYLVHNENDKEYTKSINDYENLTAKDKGHYSNKAVKRMDETETDVNCKEEIMEESLVNQSEGEKEKSKMDKTQVKENEISATSKEMDSEKMELLLRADTEELVAQTPKLQPTSGSASGMSTFAISNSSINTLIMSHEGLLEQSSLDALARQPQEKHDAFKQDNHLIDQTLAKQSTAEIHDSKTLSKEIRNFDSGMGEQLEQGEGIRFYENNLQVIIPENQMTKDVETVESDKDTRIKNICNSNTDTETAEDGSFAVIVKANDSKDLKTHKDVTKMRGTSTERNSSSDSDNEIIFEPTMKQDRSYKEGRSKEENDSGTGTKMKSEEFMFTDPQVAEFIRSTKWKGTEESFVQDNIQKEISETSDMTEIIGDSHTLVSKLLIAESGNLHDLSKDRNELPSDEASYKDISLLMEIAKEEIEQIMFSVTHNQEMTTLLEEKQNSMEEKSTKLEHDTLVLENVYKEETGITNVKQPAEDASENVILSEDRHSKDDTAVIPKVLCEEQSTLKPTELCIKFLTIDKTQEPQVTEEPPVKEISVDEELPKSESIMSPIKFDKETLHEEQAEEYNNFNQEMDEEESDIRDAGLTQQLQKDEETSEREISAAELSPKDDSKIAPMVHDDEHSVQEPEDLQAKIILQNSSEEQQPSEELLEKINSVDENRTKDQSETPTIKSPDRVIATEDVSLKDDSEMTPKELDEGSVMLMPVEKSICTNQEISTEETEIKSADVYEHSQTDEKLSDMDISAIDFSPQDDSKIIPKEQEREHSIEEPVNLQTKITLEDSSEEQQITEEMSEKIKPFDEIRTNEASKLTDTIVDEEGFNQEPLEKDLGTEQEVPKEESGTTSDNGSKGKQQVETTTEEHKENEIPSVEIPQKDVFKLIPLEDDEEISAHDPALQGADIKDIKADYHTAQEETLKDDISFEELSPKDDPEKTPTTINKEQTNLDQLSEYIESKEEVPQQKSEITSADITQEIRATKETSEKQLSTDNVSSEDDSEVTPLINDDQQAQVAEESPDRKMITEYVSLKEDPEMTPIEADEGSVMLMPVEKDIYTNQEISSEETELKSADVYELSQTVEKVSEKDILALNFPPKDDSKIVPKVHDEENSTDDPVYIETKITLDDSSEEQQITGEMTEKINSVDETRTNEETKLTDTIVGVEVFDQEPLEKDLGTEQKVPKKESGTSSDDGSQGKQQVETSTEEQKENEIRSAEMPQKDVFKFIPVTKVEKNSAHDPALQGTDVTQEDIKVDYHTAQEEIKRDNISTEELTVKDDLEITPTTIDEEQTNQDQLSEYIKSAEDEPQQKSEITSGDITQEIQVNEESSEQQISSGNVSLKDDSEVTPLINGEEQAEVAEGSTDREMATEDVSLKDGSEMTHKEFGEGSVMLMPAERDICTNQEISTEETEIKSADAYEHSQTDEKLSERDILAMEFSPKDDSKIVPKEKEGEHSIKEPVNLERKITLEDSSEEQTITEEMSEKINPFDKIRTSEESKLTDTIVDEEDFDQEPLEKDVGTEQKVPKEESGTTSDEGSQGKQQVEITTEEHKENKIPSVEISQKDDFKLIPVANVEENSAHDPALQGADIIQEDIKADYHTAQEETLKDDISFEEVAPKYDSEMTPTTIDEEQTNQDQSEYIGFREEEPQQKSEVTSADITQELRAKEETSEKQISSDNLCSKDDSDMTPLINGEEQAQVAEESPDRKPLEKDVGTEQKVPKEESGTTSDDESQGKQQVEITTEEHKENKIPSVEISQKDDFKLIPVASVEENSAHDPALQGADIIQEDIKADYHTDQEETLKDDISFEEVAPKYDSEMTPTTIDEEQTNQDQSEYIEFREEEPQQKSEVTSADITQELRANEETSEKQISSDNLCSKDDSDMTPLINGEEQAQVAEESPDRKPLEKDVGTEQKVPKEESGTTSDDGSQGKQQVEITTEEHKENKIPSVEISQKDDFKLIPVASVEENSAHDPALQGADIIQEDIKADYHTDQEETLKDDISFEEVAPKYDSEMTPTTIDEEQTNLDQSEYIEFREEEPQQKSEVTSADITQELRANEETSEKQISSDNLCSKDDSDMTPLINGEEQAQVAEESPDRKPLEKDVGTEQKVPKEESGTTSDDESQGKQQVEITTEEHKENKIPSVEISQKDDFKLIPVANVEENSAHDPALQGADIIQEDINADYHTAQEKTLKDDISFEEVAPKYDSEMTPTTIDEEQTNQDQSEYIEFREEVPQQKSEVTSADITQELRANEETSEKQISSDNLCSKDDSDMTPLINGEEQAQVAEESPDRKPLEKDVGTEQKVPKEESGTTSDDGSQGKQQVEITTEEHKENKIPSVEISQKDDFKLIPVANVEENSAHDPALQGADIIQEDIKADCHTAQEETLKDDISFEEVAPKYDSEMTPTTIDEEQTNQDQSEYIEFREEVPQQKSEVTSADITQELRANEETSEKQISSDSLCSKDDLDMTPLINGEEQAQVAEESPDKEMATADMSYDSEMTPKELDEGSVMLIPVEKDIFTNLEISTEETVQKSADVYEHSQTDEKLSEREISPMDISPKDDSKIIPKVHNEEHSIEEMVNLETKITSEDSSEEQQITEEMSEKINPFDEIRTNEESKLIVTIVDEEDFDRETLEKDLSTEQEVPKDETGTTSDDGSQGKQQEETTTEELRENEIPPVEIPQKDVINLIPVTNVVGSTAHHPTLQGTGITQGVINADYRTAQTETRKDDISIEEVTPKYDSEITPTTIDEEETNQDQSEYIEFKEEVPQQKSEIASEDITQELRAKEETSEKQISSDNDFSKDDSDMTPLSNSEEQAQVAEESPDREIVTEDVSLKDNSEITPKELDKGSVMLMPVEKVICTNQEISTEETELKSADVYEHSQTDEKLSDRDISYLDYSPKDDSKIIPKEQEEEQSIEEPVNLKTNITLEDSSEEQQITEEMSEKIYPVIEIRTNEESKLTDGIVVEEDLVQKPLKKDPGTEQIVPKEESGTTSDDGSQQNQQVGTTTKEHKEHEIPSVEIRQKGVFKLVPVENVEEISALDPALQGTDITQEDINADYHTAQKETLKDDISNEEPIPKDNLEITPTTIDEEQINQDQLSEYIESTEEVPHWKSEITSADITREIRANEETSEKQISSDSRCSKDDSEVTPVTKGEEQAQVAEEFPDRQIATEDVSLKDDSEMTPKELDEGSVMLMPVEKDICTNQEISTEETEIKSADIYEHSQTDENLSDRDISAMDFSPNDDFIIVPKAHDKEHSFEEPVKQETKITLEDSSEETSEKQMSSDNVCSKDDLELTPLINGEEQAHVAEEFPDREIATVDVSFKDDLEMTPKELVEGSVLLMPVEKDICINQEISTEETEIKSADIYEHSQTDEKLSDRDISAMDFSPKDYFKIVPKAHEKEHFIEEPVKPETKITLEDSSEETSEKQISSDNVCSKDDLELAHLFNGEEQAQVAEEFPDREIATVDVSLKDDPDLTPKELVEGSVMLMPVEKDVCYNQEISSDETVLKSANVYDHSQTDEKLSEKVISAMDFSPKDDFKIVPKAHDKEHSFEEPVKQETKDTLEDSSEGTWEKQISSDNVCSKDDSEVTPLINGEEQAQVAEESPDREIATEDVSLKDDSEMTPKELDEGSVMLMPVEKEICTNQEISIEEIELKSADVYEHSQTDEKLSDMDISAIDFSPKDDSKIIPKEQEREHSFEEPVNLETKITLEDSSEQQITEEMSEKINPVDEIRTNEESKLTDTIVDEEDFVQAPLEKNLVAEQEEPKEESGTRSDDGCQQKRQVGTRTEEHKENEIPSVEIRQKDVLKLVPVENVEEICALDPALQGTDITQGDIKADYHTAQEETLKDDISNEELIPKDNLELTPTTIDEEQTNQDQLLEYIESTEEVPQQKSEITLADIRQEIPANEETSEKQISSANICSKHDSEITPLINGEEQAQVAEESSDREIATEYVSLKDDSEMTPKELVEGSVILMPVEKDICSNQELSSEETKLKSADVYDHSQTDEKLSEKVISAMDLSPKDDFKIVPKAHDKEPSFEEPVKQETKHTLEDSSEETPEKQISSDNVCSKDDSEVTPLINGEEQAQVAEESPDREIATEDVSLKDDSEMTPKELDEGSVMLMPVEKEICTNQEIPTEETELKSADVYEHSQTDEKLSDMDISAIDFSPKDDSKIIPKEQEREHSIEEPVNLETKITLGDSSEEQKITEEMSENINSVDEIRTNEESKLTGTIVDEEDFDRVPLEKSLVAEKEEPKEESGTRSDDGCQQKRQVGTRTEEHKENKIPSVEIRQKDVFKLVPVENVEEICALDPALQGTDITQGDIKADYHTAQEETLKDDISNEELIPKDNLELTPTTIDEAQTNQDQLLKYIESTEEVPQQKSEITSADITQEIRANEETSEKQISSDNVCSKHDSEVTPLINGEEQAQVAEESPDREIATEDVSLKDDSEMTPKELVQGSVILMPVEKDICSYQKISSEETELKSADVYQHSQTNEKLSEKDISALDFSLKDDSKIVPKAHDEGHSIEEPMNLEPKITLEDSSEETWEKQISSDNVCSKDDSKVTPLTNGEEQAQVAEESPDSEIATEDVSLKDDLEMTPKELDEGSVMLMPVEKEICTNQEISTEETELKSADVYEHSHTDEKLSDMDISAIDFSPKDDSKIIPKKQEEEHSIEEPVNLERKITLEDSSEEQQITEEMSEKINPVAEVRTNEKSKQTDTKVDEEDFDQDPLKNDPGIEQVVPKEESGTTSDDGSQQNQQVGTTTKEHKEHEIPSVEIRQKDAFKLVPVENVEDISALDPAMQGTDITQEDINADYHTAQKETLKDDISNEEPIPKDNLEITPTTIDEEQTNQDQLSEYIESTEEVPNWKSEITSADITQEIRENEETSEKQISFDSRCSKDDSEVTPLTKGEEQAQVAEEFPDRQIATEDVSLKDDSEKTPKELDEGSVMLMPVEKDICTNQEISTEETEIKSADIYEHSQTDQKLSDREISTMDFSPKDDFVIVPKAHDKEHSIEEPVKQETKITLEDSSEETSEKQISSDTVCSKDDLEFTPLINSEEQAQVAEESPDREIATVDVSFKDDPDLTPKELDEGSVMLMPVEKDICTNLEISTEETEIRSADVYECSQTDEKRSDRDISAMDFSPNDNSKIILKEQEEEHSFEESVNLETKITLDDSSEQQQITEEMSEKIYSVDEIRTNEESKLTDTIVDEEDFDQDRLEKDLGTEQEVPKEESGTTSDDGSQQKQQIETSTKEHKENKIPSIENRQKDVFKLVPVENVEDISPHDAALQGIDITQEDIKADYHTAQEETLKDDISNKELISKDNLEITPTTIDEEQTNQDQLSEYIESTEEIPRWKSEITSADITQEIRENETSEKQISSDNVCSKADLEMTPLIKGEEQAQVAEELPDKEIATEDVSLKDDLEMTPKELVEVSVLLMPVEKDFCSYQEISTEETEIKSADIYEHSQTNENLSEKDISALDFSPKDDSKIVPKAHDQEHSIEEQVNLETKITLEDLSEETSEKQISSDNVCLKDDSEVTPLINGEEQAQVANESLERENSSEDVSPKDDSKMTPKEIDEESVNTVEEQQTTAVSKNINCIDEIRTNEGSEILQTVTDEAKNDQEASEKDLGTEHEVPNDESDILQEKQKTDEPSEKEVLSGHFLPGANLEIMPVETHMNNSRQEETTSEEQKEKEIPSVEIPQAGFSELITEEKSEENNIHEPTKQNTDVTPDYLKADYQNAERTTIKHISIVEVPLKNDSEMTATTIDQETANHKSLEEDIKTAQEVSSQISEHTPAYMTQEMHGNKEPSAKQISNDNLISEDYTEVIIQVRDEEQARVVGEPPERDFSTEDVSPNDLSAMTSKEFNDDYVNHEPVEKDIYKTQEIAKEELTPTIIDKEQTGHGTPEKDTGTAQDVPKEDSCITTADTFEEKQTMEEPLEMEISAEHLLLEENLQILPQFEIDECQQEESTTEVQKEKVIPSVDNSQKDVSEIVFDAQEDSEIKSADKIQQLLTDEEPQEREISAVEHSPEVDSKIIPKAHGEDHSVQEQVIFEPKMNGSETEVINEQCTQELPVISTTKITMERTDIKPLNLTEGLPVKETVKLSHSESDLSPTVLEEEKGAHEPAEKDIFISQDVAKDDEQYVPHLISDRRVNQNEQQLMEECENETVELNDSVNELREEITSSRDKEDVSDMESNEVDHSQNKADALALRKDEHPNGLPKKKEERSSDVSERGIFSNDEGKIAKAITERPPDTLRVREETSFLESEADEIIITEADATETEGKESMFSYDLDDVTVILYIDNEKLAKNSFQDSRNMGKKRKPRPVAKLGPNMNESKHTFESKKTRKDNLSARDNCEPDDSWTDISELEVIGDKDISEIQTVSLADTTEVTITEADAMSEVTTHDMSANQTYTNTITEADAMSEVTTHDMSANQTYTNTITEADAMSEVTTHDMSANQTYTNTINKDFTACTTESITETSTFTNSEFTTYEKHLYRLKGDDKSEYETLQETTETNEEYSDSFDAHTTGEASVKRDRAQSKDAAGISLRKSSLSDIEDLPSENEN